MKIQELIPAFEAVLFAGGEPISAERFAEVFEISEKDVAKVMDFLADRMTKSGSGLELLKLGNAYQLATKTAYAEQIKKVFDMRRRTPLSSAALEVLAVVAYNQPVTKAFVEQVRGVDCTGVIGTLIEKGLIEEKGRLELPGKPLLYGTTKNFLRCFNLSDLTELPEPPKTDNQTADIGEQLTMDNEITEKEQID